MLSPIQFPSSILIWNQGLGEFTMRNFAKENGCEESWETIVMRPSGVLKKDMFRFLNLAIADTIGFISEYCPQASVSWRWN